MSKTHNLTIHAGSAPEIADFFRSYPEAHAALVGADAPDATNRLVRRIHTRIHDVAKPVRDAMRAIEEDSNEIIKVVLEDQERIIQRHRRLKAERPDDKAWTAECDTKHTKEMKEFREELDKKFYDAGITEREFAFNFVVGAEDVEVKLDKPLSDFLQKLYEHYVLFTAKGQYENEKVEDGYDKKKKRPELPPFERKTNNGKEPLKLSELAQVNLDLGLALYKDDAERDDLILYREQLLGDWREEELRKISRITNGELPVWTSAQTSATPRKRSSRSDQHQSQS